MPVPTVCPNCGANVSISRDGKGAPGDVTTADCPECEFVEQFG